MSEWHSTPKTETVRTYVPPHLYKGNPVPPHFHHPIPILISLSFSLSHAHKVITLSLSLSLSHTHTEKNIKIFEKQH